MQCLQLLGVVTRDGSSVSKLYKTMYSIRFGLFAGHKGYSLVYNIVLIYLSVCPTIVDLAKTAKTGTEHKRRAH